MMKIDERDTMLSRIRYQEGDGMYEEYYARHPEKKEIDDMLRAMPGINAEGTSTYHPIFSPFADSGFEFMDHVKKISKQTAKGEALKLDPQEMSDRLKRLALYLGASDVKITRMKPHHYYSHRGRTKENYGTEVGVPYEYGLVFVKEMDKTMINRAPQMEEMFEVIKTYADLSVIGMWLAIFISNLGHEAKNNMDMDYLICAPVVAQDAGLGQIGRAGLLVHKKYGMRVRIGAVTTNLPLVPDVVDSFDLIEFCTECGLCAANCPSKAIDRDEPCTTEMGYYGFKVNQESCMKMWKTVGTDCGVCLSSCPFSQGVDESLTENLKNNMQLILDEHKKKYGRRNYVRESLDVVK